MDKALSQIPKKNGNAKRTIKHQYNFRKKKKTIQHTKITLLKVNYNKQYNVQNLGLYFPATGLDDRV